MGIANDVQFAVAKATCKRRKIGAVLYDADGVILAYGWNGPEDFNCLQQPCPGADIPAGTGGAGGLTSCYAIHAEARALAQCDKTRIAHCVSSKAPCLACVQKLLATPCQKISFFIDSNDQSNKALWVNAGRAWEILK